MDLLPTLGRACGVAIPDEPALDGVDVSIASGDLVAIIGPSGAGKSTLLHMMGALDRPTDGTIEIAEVPQRGNFVLREAHAPVHRNETGARPGHVAG